MVGAEGSELLVLEGATRGKKQGRRDYGPGVGCQRGWRGLDGTAHETTHGLQTWPSLHAEVCIQLHHHDRSDETLLPISTLLEGLVDA